VKNIDGVVQEGVGIDEVVAMEEGADHFRP
jgi:hypothetical protein